MLKQAVKLIDVASGLRATVLRLDTRSEFEETVEESQDAIDELTESVGTVDGERRKTDEAICLLFRAYGMVAALAGHHAGYEEAVQDTDKLVKRAEALLGFAVMEEV